MKKHLVLFLLIVTLVFALSGNGEGISSSIKGSVKSGIKKGINATDYSFAGGFTPPIGGSSTPYRDSLYVIVDNTDGNGALSNYANLLILNSRSFRKAGNSATEFSKVTDATVTINQIPSKGFWFINKATRAYVPHFIQKWDTTNGSRIWFKLSNTSAAKDELVMFYNNLAPPDCSNIKTVFPAGDDFGLSTYSNLVQINDSACGLTALQSASNLVVTDTANNHNAKHGIGNVSNLVYYPTDATEPYKVITSGHVTGQGFTTDSSQLWLWTATSRNQLPYTNYATAIINDKAGVANTHGGCSQACLVLVQGASAATDSLYCFFFYDSTSVTNDGIYVSASQASDGVTWTEKVKVLSNATNKVSNPVVTYEGGVWYLFYSYTIEVVFGEGSVGLATLSQANPRATFTVSNNKFIPPNTGATGVNAADSNFIAPVSIAKIGSSYWLSCAVIVDNALYPSNRAGAILTGTGANPSAVTFARTAPLGESNNVITRGVFTFLDSVDTSTGLGGFVWQYSGSDSGATRFDFNSRIYNETYNELNANGYYVYGAGTQIPQNFSGIDTVRSQYHVRDSLGNRIFGASPISYHPVRYSGGSGGLMTYNYPVTQDFEIVTEVQNRNWRVVNSASPASATRFGFTIAVGDTPIVADSLTNNTKIYYNYVNSRDATGQWARTFLTGSNYFNLNDTLSAGVPKGDFRMGRSGFTTTADTANAVDGYLYAGNSWASYINQMDGSNIFAFRYPSISTTKWSDSVLTVFMNDYAVAQTYDKFDAVQRARSKKFIGFGFNEGLSGGGGEGLMKYWFVRNIQTNYREPQCYTIKPNATLADTTSYTVGQGAYDSSYVRDACILAWGASNAERNRNYGASVAANNSLGFVNSTAVEESRMLLWFSNAMVPYNFQLDSAVIDIYLTAGNVGGTDADGNIFMVFEVLKDWVEGNLNGTIDKTMCSWTRRGSGTGVGGTTIASSDSNWFTNAANFSIDDREDFSHIWGISSSDTIKSVGTGRDNTHVTFNVTPIVRKQFATGVNYGFIIRDVSTKGTGNYYKRPDSRESATAGQRPKITYYGKLAS